MKGANRWLPDLYKSGIGSDQNTEVDHRSLVSFYVDYISYMDATLNMPHIYMYVHAYAADITKDKVQGYLNRISAVYSNIDSEFLHGNEIGKYLDFD